MAVVPHGPDSGYSWVIVLCCSYIHFALFGLFRSAGVIYVAMLQNYDVTREEASWPFALCAAVFQLVGPVASVITHYISQRKACLLGSAIATIGIAGCYFADSVMWINIFYGIVHGLGFGLVVTLVPVTLNQYFVKHRATAIGMAFSGGTMSSLIFPSVMEWLLDNYTLRDSFLLLSGVVMNMLVASSMLRAPPWLTTTTPSDEKDSGLCSTTEIIKSTTDRDTEKTLYHIDQIRPVDDDSALELKSTDRDMDIKSTTNRDSCDTVDGDDDSALGLKSTNRDSSCETDKTLYQISEIGQDDTIGNNDSVLFDEDGSAPVKEPQTLYQISEIAQDDTIPNNDSVLFDEAPAKEPLMGVVRIEIQPKKDPSPPPSGVRHSLMDILKTPSFHLITFTMCVYFLGVHSFFMVIVDFAKDKGIPEHQGVYVISMFSLTDLIGRAGLGWVTDRGFVSRRCMVALNLGALGVLYQLYPVIDELSGILVVAAFTGLAVGSSITLFFVLQAECFEMRQLTMVIGLTSFINGTTSLLRPGIIGLFRDVIGSYDWMFHFLGFNFLIISIIWFIASWRKRENDLRTIHNSKR